MKQRYEKGDTWEKRRAQIIGLGERSIRKSYYPELRKRLEELELYFAIVENSGDAIVVTTEVGRIVKINPAARELFGLVSEKEPGNLFSETFWVDLSQRERLLALMQGQGAVRGYEASMKRLDGKTLAVRISSTRMVSGKDVFLINVIHDMTRRKRIEKQLRQKQKMEAIGTLAGGIAHDFNNLLMGISGNASLALMELAPGQAGYEKVKSIETYVRDAAKLTRQLLGLARNRPLEIRSVDINRIVAKTADMFGRTRKEIEIKISPGDGLGSILADSGQIEQVLLNLLVNAWQAMAGGGEIYIGTENVVLDDEFAIHFNAPAGNYIRVSVTDTGSGMDEATREKIFEPFFTTKEDGKGTGLGLASAYGIIKNHGGFINVYSEVGHGSTLSLYLPEGEEKVEAFEIEERQLFTGEETILLIDDEAMIQDVGGKMLEKLGYRVWTAESGAAGVKIFEEKHREIDLVVLDLIMPKMNGAQVFDRIRSIDPKAAVLLASGYSIDGQARALLDKGCRGFIQKPFNLPDLSARVRKVLDSAPAAGS